MKTPVIRVSSENSDFQYIDTLRRNRTKRHQAGEFFMEGVRAINQALNYGWQITAWIYSREKRLSDWASGILARSQAKRHYELTLPLLEKLSQKEEPSELLALAAIPADDLGRISFGITTDRPSPLVVVLDRPSSPGNLGAMIRSGDALGVDGLVITGHAVDLYDPETIHATTGSFFAVPVVRLPSHKELLPWIEALKGRFGGLQIIGTSARARLPLFQQNFIPPTVLLIGNENHGLSESYRALCDTLVTIPMMGSASSMNIACATSILLYEIARQRAGTTLTDPGE